MPVTLEISALNKNFGKQPVLEDINLSVNEGEFLTFLGPSGSGKTTLLRLVGGFEHPDHGQIFLQGQEISQLPPHKRRVNTVFQNYALFPHLSVHQNIAFGLRNLGISKSGIHRKVEAALEMVQLAGYESRFPEQLSGGQQQRVALARALVMEPKVLLLDEPFGALDQKLRKEMQIELKALQRRVGLTFIFVTHDQEEALSLSDRIVVLNQGHLEQVGRPEEIYERPRTRFVADFMGMENILSLIAIEEEEDWLHCRTKGGQTIHALKQLHQNGRFRFYAVRPSKIALSRTPPDEGFANILKGQIREGSYLGSAHHWSVAVGPDETWKVTQPLYGNQVSGARFSVQDEVYLCWDGQSGILLIDV
jgi:spermidine/putrescine transport system ATP-binding protein